MSTSPSHLPSPCHRQCRADERAQHQDCDPSCASPWGSAELRGASGRQGVDSGYVGSRSWHLITGWSRLEASDALCLRMSGTRTF